MNICLARPSVSLLDGRLPAAGLHVPAADAELDHALAARVHELARVGGHVLVAAVLRRVMRRKSSSGHTILPDEQTRHRRRDSRGVPGGDAVLLVLALALLLALLTAALPRLYQHLRNCQILEQIVTITNLTFIFFLT